LRLHGGKDREKCWGEGKSNEQKNGKVRENDLYRKWVVERNKERIVRDTPVGKVAKERGGGS